MPGKPVEVLPSGGSAAMRAMFEQEVVGVGQVDVAGRLISANERLAAMLGYPQDELLGTSVEALVPTEGRAEARARLGELWRTGSGYVVETEYQRKDLSSVWGASSITAVRDDAGDVTSLLAFVVDI